MDHKVNAETMRHILTVRAMLMESVGEIYRRSVAHDLSKLEDPEATGFAEFTEQLKHLTYGSQEYKNTLKEMDYFIQHHYANNPHHPEHHIDGIMGMNLFDLIEMLCDWKASTLRHKNGDLNKSLELNKERFNIPEPLYRILQNTIDTINAMAITAKVHVSYPYEE